MTMSLAPQFNIDSFFLMTILYTYVYHHSNLCQRTEQNINIFKVKKHTYAIWRQRTHSISRRVYNGGYAIFYLLYAFIIGQHDDLASLCKRYGYYIAASTVYH